jgi:hypothetical protein
MVLNLMAPIEHGNIDNLATWTQETCLDVAPLSQEHQLHPMRYQLESWNYESVTTSFMEVYNCYQTHTSIQTQASRLLPKTTSRVAYH